MPVPSRILCANERFCPRSSHSLLAEMVELTAPQGAEEKLPILWTSFIGGEQNSYFYNLHAMMDGIEQVFEQSPYLQR